MKRPTFRGFAAVGGSLLVLMIGSSRADEPCQDCGPGSHWIDSCTGGSDIIDDSEARIGIDLNLDNIADTNLILVGAATINRTGPLNASLTSQLLPGRPDTQDRMSSTPRLSR